MPDHHKLERLRDPSFCFVNFNFHHSLQVLVQARQSCNGSLQILMILIVALVKGTAPFPFPTLLHGPQNVQDRLESCIVWALRRSVAMQLGNLNWLSMLSSAACPTKWSISRDNAARIHPCAPCSPELCAMCFGPATSKAVLMSNLAMYIVGRLSPPCRVPFFLSHYHSQCLCNS